MAAKSHDHICVGCGAIYPYPDPTRCPCATAGCEPQDDVEIIGCSDDGFEAIIRPYGKSTFRV